MRRWLVIVVAAVVAAVALVVYLQHRPVPGLIAQGDDNDPMIRWISLATAALGTITAVAQLVMVFVERRR